MEKITTVLDEETDIASPADARRIERVEGHVALESVTFAYGREPVLHGIDLDIPAGTCVALVGMSGGGKSTLARLVGRFYDPREGAVSVDGNDLREIDLVHYRRQLGVVLQDPFLFAGSIADNLRFAAPDASDELVEETARAIGLDRVAARFSEGLDHAVREGGSGLSAGERQLISIGRALLADPRILILDEATSNIDRPTEVLIERALDRLLHGRTSIVIAHRLATVRRADEIVVLDRGRIVERGSEAELMAAARPVRGARARSRGAGAGGRRLMSAVASGYVGILSFELHFPGERSLKGKRKHLLDPQEPPAAARGRIRGRGRSPRRLAARAPDGDARRPRGRRPRRAARPLRAAGLRVGRRGRAVHAPRRHAGGSDMSERVRRVNELMRQILGEALGEMTDPGLGFVTVTSVDCSRDFEHAIVYVSVLGNDVKRKRSMEALERATGPPAGARRPRGDAAPHAAAALRLRRDVRQGPRASSSCSPSTSRCPTTSPIPTPIPTPSPRTDAEPATERRGRT